MRRFLALSLSLLVAACATRPITTAPVSEQPSEEPRSGLVGMTTEDLVRRFGTPALQIREGESLKLQFRDAQCVLDAYLYPGRNGAYHVTYVDTRTRALGAIDQAACVSALEDR